MDPRKKGENPTKLESKARAKLSQNGWFYASSNARQSYTHRANRDAFDRRRILPRTLVGPDRRETRTEVFGRSIAAPVCFTPVGINKIYHGKAELPVARVAGRLGGGVRWFQLYMPHDEELTMSLLERAWGAGFDVLILTTDTWQLGWRHDDIAMGNYAFYHGRGASLGLTDPVFQRRLKEAGIDAAMDSKAAAQKWIDTIWHGRPHTWEKVRWVLQQWKTLTGGRPFVVKRIQDARDAERAVEVGCDGVVVSNHAGRQINGAVTSLDALEGVVGAVGGRTTVLFDSEARSGSDVFKALAMGARAVLVGRLWVWGLAVQGEVGVEHVMRSLLAEFDLTMELAGCRRVEDIRRDCVKRKKKGFLFNRNPAAPTRKPEEIRRFQVVCDRGLAL
ncbi:L-lactate dehydrogenase [Morchella conica CCBAS932]|uniref:L-lactate dehydrogenase n=1 Tax=Morchella conica CCBAS932 TaxID=1392247 RepID=A0A3N4KQ03_9PEZI|nr:L-lactate dehydrogenase [Morchella conica CCBAS932]